MSEENKESLSSDLAGINSKIDTLLSQLEALGVRVAVLESAPVPAVPTFPDYNGAIDALHTDLDALQGRLAALEVSPVTTADRAAVSDFGVDPIWIKAIFEKYFWNEKPVAPANVADDNAG